MEHYARRGIIHFEDNGIEIANVSHIAEGYDISLDGYNFEYYVGADVMEMYETDDHASYNGKLCGYVVETKTTFYQPFDEPYLRQYLESIGKEKLYLQLYEICKLLCGGNV